MDHAHTEKWNSCLSALGDILETSRNELLVQVLIKSHVIH